MVIMYFMKIMHKVSDVTGMVTSHHGRCKRLVPLTPGRSNKLNGSRNAKNSPSQSPDCGFEDEKGGSVQ